MIKGIGLALGGGSVKGFAHIGILRVLKREKIPVTAICGTSMGAIIGGLYSISENLEKVEASMFGLLEQEGFRQLSKPDKKHRHSPLGEYSDIIRMEKKMREALPDKDLKDTKVPFIAIAADLKNGEMVVIRDGPMKEALAASSSIPGVMNPIRVQGRFLVDGILSDNVPVREVRKIGAGKVLAVHVTPSISFKDDPKGKTDVLFRSFMLMLNKMSLGSGNEADLLLEPDLSSIPYADLHYARLAAEIGEKIALENVDRIRKLVEVS